MEHIFVRTNTAKDPDLKITKKIKGYIEDMGMRCTLSTEAKLPADADGILVLGGDGTMLNVAGETLDAELPILGINLGTMGYLTEVPLEKAKAAIERLANEEYTVSERMMLEGSVTRDGKVIYEGFALNDIVLTRQGSLRIIHFDTTVNKQTFNEYDADGLIVATPTGSTGYNMSAGGPIVEPGAKVMVMTPICAHMFNSRSIVLSGKDEIGIYVNADRTGHDQMVEVTFDAEHNLSLTTGDVINVKQASKVTRIVRLNEASFITALHQKMNS
ncbi:MAG: NAD(+)/NADH kinase [Lachnospiraceae bacterium]|nr:NAD(+)/NADH kinase [Lachnospiraceae bacterium]MBR4994046.1 NAD(+)/NADH kinase [Lachnospiraceae bacterium]MBR5944239.1 NAD(+)/NADH kinase [Lachnospiraceae bacterium]